MRYAEGTSVSVEKSRAEIESTLSKYGASQFAYATDSVRGLASIQFAAKERHIRFVLKLPSLEEKQFKFTPSLRNRRNSEDQYRAWEQACRQRWRALALCVKAKLEAVQCGISTFEDEFMAQIVLPSGQTVSQLMRPQISKAYLTGEVPSGIQGLLPAPEESNEVS